MKIHFKNTLSGQIEEFKPIKENEVGMYNCGPTVYGRVHIGNMRAYIFADLIKNVLTYNGFKVHQVINITDVGHLVDDGDDGEDKMEKRAKEDNLSAADIAKEYTEYFYKKLDELNIDRSSIDFPKATDNIQEQIDLIKSLEEKGFAYTISDGVYFDTSKFPAYGELGHIDIKGLQEGARVESNSEKRNITDFALWKFSKEKRQQEWPSPWGMGFPGWHIECSAMAAKYLGNTFDIHTGGVDHIPTHHNNEIAQSVAAHDAPLSNYWLHVNHITIDGKKISKSLGNTVYVEDFKKHDICNMAYKYWLYTSNYETLSNFTWEAVKASHTSYRNIVNFLKNVKDTDGKVNALYIHLFLESVYNDLNTANAIAIMHLMLNEPRSVVSDKDKKATILEFDKILKLDFANAILPKDIAEIPDVIKELADERKFARLNRDYAKSDAIREKIDSMGFTIKDTDDIIGYSIEKK